MFWFSGKNRFTTSHLDNSTFIDAKNKWSNASNDAIRKKTTRGWPNLFGFKIVPLSKSSLKLPKRHQNETDGTFGPSVMDWQLPSQAAQGTGLPIQAPNGLAIAKPSHLAELEGGGGREAKCYFCRSFSVLVLCSSVRRNEIAADNAQVRLFVTNSDSRSTTNSTNSIQQIECFMEQPKLLGHYVVASI